MTLGVGIYGQNGHQIQNLLVNHPHARLVAIAAFDPAALPEALRGRADVRQYATLEQLLGDQQVELVSLCSPRRCDQANDAVRALKAGKHVYAEKPCALSEAELETILATARQSGRQFHEMAGTAFEQPYLSMRQLVQAGTIGTVVQVLAQKSYPYFDGRPQDEAIDGGLLAQVGVHGVRFIEHVAGTPVIDVQAVQSALGNPKAGGLQMAACLMMKLANGGVASLIANYLNPRGFGSWGNETLRIFGTLGMLEATDGGKRTRLIVGQEDRGPIDTSQPGFDYFDAYAATLCGAGQMPLEMEEELHPTRIVLRGRLAALEAQAKQKL